MRDDSDVDIELTRDARAFATRTQAFLAERVQRNVLATVLADSLRGRFDAHPPLFARVEDRGRLVAVVMRTPPWPLLASERAGCAAGLLLERWLAEDPLVPGVAAEGPAARAIAAAWIARTGGCARRSMREAMHLLEEVEDPPRPAAGRLRPAGPEDRELLVGWERAFVAEAGTGVAGEAGRVVAARLAAGRQYVWEDGEPVCTLALSAPIAGTVRIGLVYTPPRARRRGYAGSAVAAACRRCLDAGAQRCMLFTDLANPTSNRIYASVGFRRFADWEEHAFALP